jgi:hypothetical protein
MLEARACIRRGQYFNLDRPLDAFDPPILSHRRSLEHRIFGSSPHHRDDALDSFFLQSGSQLDGLRHFRHPKYGFYNRTPDDAVLPGNPRIGINRLAEHGVVGRGVLIDVERFLARKGTPIDAISSVGLGVDLIEEIAATQGVAFRSGDILMLRTGWLQQYFALSDAERQSFPRQMRCAGLKQSHETLAWLWDNQFSICASDNFAVECIPPHQHSPFAAETAEIADVHPRHAGMMHPNLIAMLGVTLGEQWDFEALAEDCAEDGVWECFVACKPLNLIGGVGSPANAFALK